MLIKCYYLSAVEDRTIINGQQTTFVLIKLNYLSVSLFGIACSLKKEHAFDTVIDFELQLCAKHMLF